MELCGKLVEKCKMSHIITNTMAWRLFLKIGTSISLVKLTFKETHTVQKSLFQDLIQLASETTKNSSGGVNF